MVFLLVLAQITMWILTTLCGGVMVAIFILAIRNELVFDKELLSRLVRFFMLTLFFGMTSIVLMTP